MLSCCILPSESLVLCPLYVIVIQLRGTRLTVSCQWRYVLFASLFAYELVFLLSPSPTPPSSTTLSSFLFSDPSSPSHNSVLGLLWPNRVAYQHIRFLHSLFMMCSVAVSRVAPVLFSSPAQMLNTNQLMLELSKLNGLAQAADAEGSSRIPDNLASSDVMVVAVNMLQIELHSCHGEATGTQPIQSSFPHVEPLPKPADEVMNLLTREMENMVIEGKLLKEAEAGPLQTSVKMAAERRKLRDQQHAAEETGRMSASPARLPATPSRRLGVTRPLGSPLASFQSRIPEGYIRGRSQSC